MEALYANNFEELYSIHQSEFNIGFLSTKTLEPEKLQNFLEDNFEKIPGIFKCFISKDNFEEEIEELGNLYYILDDSAEKEQLINYVKTLVSNFADISDAPLLGISVEKVRGNMCKFFHCDMNHLRLVYPLLGPGTLWATEDNIRREYLGKGLNDLVIVDPLKINQVPPKTITLLKGQGHPSANNKAVVHASPEIAQSQTPRILLRIESIF